MSPTAWQDATSGAAALIPLLSEVWRRRESTIVRTSVQSEDAARRLGLEDVEEILTDTKEHEGKLFSTAPTCL